MKAWMACFSVAAGLVSSCLGFGGFGATAGFADFAGLDERLTEHNRTWGGRESFRSSTPLWWIGGHGAGLVGDVTLGGWGVATARGASADSLEASLLGLMGGFEVGYAYSPVEYCWVRPCLDLGIGLSTHYAHSVESFSQPNFSRWYLEMSTGFAPGLELMGRLRYREVNYIGLFVKGSYSLPVIGPVWFGDADPPEFSFKGFSLHLGLRFGKLSARWMRI